MGKRNTLVSLVVGLLLLSALSNGMIILLPFVEISKAVDITTYSDTNTTINVTVYEALPIVNWFDVTNGASVSVMNSNTKIDVEEEYNFSINVTSMQGWADIQYINIIE